ARGLQRQEAALHDARRPGARDAGLELQVVDRDLEAGQRHRRVDRDLDDARSRAAARTDVRRAGVALDLALGVAAVARDRGVVVALLTGVEVAVAAGGRRRVDRLGEVLAGRDRAIDHAAGQRRAAADGLRSDARAGLLDLAHRHRRGARAGVEAGRADRAERA